jgi:hypothetical protein
MVQAAISDSSLPPHILQEAKKIETQIRDIAAELLNMDLDLGRSISLSVEKRELEAYLQGIRFAMGDAPARASG